MIIRSPRRPDRIRLIAIENMKGAFGNEGALRFRGHWPASTTNLKPLKA